MLKKIAFLIIVILFFYLGFQTPDKAQTCIDSGGTVSTSMACKSIEDFPNSCLIGPFGCSLDNSHEVQVCDCGPGKCFDGNECISSDKAIEALEDLKQETGIGFSEIKEAEFKWIVKLDPEINEETVIGKEFEANVISSEQYDSIHDFFINNDFKTDVYNFAAGTISESRGYKKDKTVCMVSGGLTGYKEAEEQWIPTDTDNWDINVKCGELEKTEIEYATEDWQTYTNEKHGYSVKYPVDCLYGPLPGYCKQSPPEQRSKECLCYFNAEDENNVSLGTFTGTKSDLTGASFVVFHSIHSDYYSPPADTNLVQLIKENVPHYENIPDEINADIDGIPALKIYTPFSGMAWSQEDIYFIKDNKLFQITLLDVDNENNRELYNNILSTFKISQ